MAAPPDWITLRLFLTAIELGSIAKAADRCGIANSAAAKRIQVLEAQTRTALVERHARGIVPTAAGEAFARHARGLLDLARHLEDEMDAFAAGGAGTVRLLATASCIGGHGLARALAGFTRLHPRIVVDLRELTSAAILQDLIEGRADLGIVTTNARIPVGLEAQPWREDRLLAIVSADHPLAVRKDVRFSEVLEYPLVDVLEIGALSLLLAEAAQGLGRKPHYRYRVTSMDAARRLVAAGLAINVMPDGMIEPYAQSLGVRGIPIDEPWSLRRLRLVSRAETMSTGPARRLASHLLNAPAAGTSVG
ncbi:LysR family transcriptional regulator [Xanthobacter oligotrophicus]|uniref:LysR family transcriptional regulator n=1 Tax=Xanthobacter oligotrophicus TaxID=2607286 RepID=UPI00165E3A04|nr:LysR family transcriptional regulator [Xanthobacter oligotrophicus]MCG5237366.1 LysR family transcriptional regulator [Xanthobacter oligotrophicus]